MNSIILESTTEVHNKKHKRNNTNKELFSMSKSKANPISKRNYLSLLFSFLSISLLLLSTTGCNNRIKKKTNTEEEVVIKTEQPVTYNLYIENSGSMKGYFSTKNSSLKSIIKQYYDRLYETNSDKDTITLNFINTKIEPFKSDIISFINKSYNNCTAQYTKLDDILEMAMGDSNDNDINILVSDFGFTSSNSSLDMAKSGITALFSKKILKDKGLSIAIIKYECDFNGIYYPGRFRCNHKLPIYFWVFGNNSQIKHITRLPIEDEHQMMVIQNTQEFTPTYIVTNKRMLGKDNTILVSKWNKERRSNQYILKMNVDLSSISLTEDYLLNIDNYSINEGYVIDDIIKINKDNDIYEFIITTEHPSPGNIAINLNHNIPEWVEESNYEGNKVPDEGQTAGIKALIEGVYNAYHNSNKHYFSININLI